MTRVTVLAASRDASSAVARFVAGSLRATPDLVLGLPSGRTPIDLYRALVELHRRRQADFSRAAVFGLDELLGLAPGDPRSYGAFLRAHLLDHVNVASGRIRLLNGAAGSWQREADIFERSLAALGGLDLAIVGIGKNGHVAFNEPAASLQPRTHRARLQPATRRATAHLFGGRWREVPTHGLTMGIGSILGARAVILLALGREKARIVGRALTGPITTRLPASLLQVHPNAMFVLDRAAAGGLYRPAGKRGPELRTSYFELRP